MADVERTLIIIKPDAVSRGLVGEIVERFEKKGLKIVAMKMEVLEKEKLKEHYAHHADKEFFNDLISYMASGPILLTILEGANAVNIVRNMVGATDARKAAAGTIRGDYGMSNQNNLVHASESKEIANKEIEMFFTKEEIFSYKRADEEWLS